jgi:UDP-N-acetylglucosamine 2-epimerase (non-hydrolysing)
MKVILVCGTRPNFMKVAPLLRAMQGFNETRPKFFEPILVHTGQHYDYEVSKVFFKDLALPAPDIYLSVGSGTHAEQTGRVMIRFEKVLFQERPDLVTVVGDVNSTLAAALATAKLGIPIAHIEAGERTGDFSIPEEANRLLTDILSEYLFCATPDACENLKKEGIPASRISHVGNIMVDSLLCSTVAASRRRFLSRLGLRKGDYALLTLHRPDNVDDKPTFLGIISAISEISQRIPILFPAHPRTVRSIKQFGLEGYFSWLDNNKAPFNGGIYLVKPLGYLDFIKAEMNARFILTDSGGIQAETTMLNVPCLTLYRVTEWTVTLTRGSNTLVGTEPLKIMAEAFRILEGRVKTVEKPELWDGRTAERIVEIFASSR